MGMVRRVLPNLVAAVVDATVAGIYIVLVASPSDPSPSTRAMAFSALLSALAAFSLLSGLAAIRFPQASDDLRLSAGVGNLGLGILSLASIGVPLLIAGLVLLVTDPPGKRSVPRRLLAPTITIVVTVLVVLGTYGQ